MIEALEASKTEYEGRGLDFEGDLVKSYSQLRKTMSEKYEETDFGPTAVSEPTKSMEEVSKEEFKEHKKNADGQQKAIKLGYDRIKAKVKKLRSNFQKAVAEGTRSGGAFSGILISSAVLNNKRHNEADHKRKLGTSCMFHVNIHVSYRSHVITSYFQTGLM